MKRLTTEQHLTWMNQAKRDFLTSLEKAGRGQIILRDEPVTSRELPCLEAGFREGWRQAITTLRLQGYIKEDEG